jgi:hypothetical protein
MDSLEKVLSNVFTGPMLEGMAEGTEFEYGLLEGIQVYYLRLRTNHVVTVQAITRHEAWDIAMTSEGAFVSLINGKCRWVRKWHELGWYYNIFPGWRF